MRAGKLLKSLARLNELLKAATDHQTLPSVLSLLHGPCTEPLLPLVSKVLYSLRHHRALKGASNPALDEESHTNPRVVDLVAAEKGPGAILQKLNSLKHPVHMHADNISTGKRMKRPDSVLKFAPAHSPLELSIEALNGLRSVQVLPVHLAGNEAAGLKLKDGNCLLLLFVLIPVVNSAPRRLRPAHTLLEGFMVLLLDAHPESRLEENGGPVHVLKLHLSQGLKGLIGAVFDKNR
mmetsp:Transcript_6457/g.12786  ORF Transcript_6457/g.12786 Transcript_6457/m.12786 type:complete len:236 (+) Transcript_6457:2674-3381(+)